MPMRSPRAVPVRLGRQAAGGIKLAGAALTALVVMLALVRSPTAADDDTVHRASIREHAPTGSAAEAARKSAAVGARVSGALSPLRT
ncbi:MAG: hypothetical protein NW223_07435 [Hyphomicrobiaceae bacterium]|nr:hypothetical protein [Hyphomicrobiaceae bacterium]